MQQSIGAGHISSFTISPYSAIMLVRTGLVARQRMTAPLITQRNASHHAEQEDPDVYTKEGFTSPAWRRFFLVSILAGAAYKFAPEPSEDAFITRWLAMYTTSSERWLDLNASHTVLSQDSADAVRLFTTAARPPVHRMRFPQMMDNASPFNVPVGLSADTRDFVTKNEHE
ncbi:hypothetical protein D9757_004297 [Collybiopsis confluens]|uniref:Uncharacterized protein n=1 Tax=Collybiopsis confluens TaxID=2823264 RepID=A0A8H5HTT7_9AGAR|nr:hypothetical protein D9757_004297 [Collybiopsis confluens]